MNFEGCSESVSNNRKITFQEQKTKFTFENNIRSVDITKIQVDGCLIFEGKKCDWLLLINNSQIEVYIELKGCRVIDALKQLENTVQKVSQHPKLKFCYVICARSPLSSPEIQNKAKSFKKKYNVTLRFKSSGSSEKLSSLIA